MLSWQEHEILPFVLVVDDDLAARDILSRRLNTRGYRIECCDNADSALARLAEELPDLVLMDVRMPGTSGLDALVKIRNRWTPGELPVLLVTSLKDPEDVIAGLDAGANDFIIKPVNLPVLIARMRVCLAVRAAMLAKVQAEQSLRHANEVLDLRVQQRTAELADLNANLRALGAQVSLAEEQERRRIARGLHDHIGQALAVTQMKLRSVRESSSPEVVAMVDEIRQWLDRAIGHVRDLTFELGAKVLYDFGLGAAVENLVERLALEFAMDASFTEDDQPKPLDEAVQVAMYQACRELLHNITKHADARIVRVKLIRDVDLIRLVITDNGGGFSVDASLGVISPTGGFGLFSIRERMNYLGGRLLIDSKIRGGTTAVLEAPLAKSPAKMGEFT
jgi:two-component system sensor histidine kinase/response regulator